MGTFDLSNDNRLTILLFPLQLMNELFDRPVIILETDRSKSDDGHAIAHPSRNLLGPALSRTKYIDALVSQLTRSKIQVLYSDGPQDTADIVELLRKKEAAKGHGFPSPLEIGDRDRRVLPLYQVINM